MSDNRFFPSDEEICKNCKRTAERHSDHGDCPGGSGGKFRMTDYILEKANQNQQRSFEITKPDGSKLLFDSPEDAETVMQRLQEGF